MEGQVPMTPPALGAMLDGGVRASFPDLADESDTGSSSVE